MCVTFPDRLSWILLLEHITRKCLFPCCGLCLHHSSSFIISNQLLNQSFLYLCVQEDDAVVVWGRLQSHCPDLQPHQSWLVPEDTRVILTLIPSEDQRCCYGTVSKFAPPKKGCGWVLCFHVYQKAAVQVQVSLQPTLRGTFWSIWPRTVRQSLRSGSSESKSTTCQRPGKDALLTTAR